MIFTFSISCIMDLTLLENNWWFLSFHRTPMQQSQTMWRNERRELCPPEENMNWWKWSMICWGSSEYTPIQDFTSCRSEPKIEQCIIRCSQSSISLIFTCWVWVFHYFIIIPSVFFYAHWFPLVLFLSYLSY